MCRGRRRGWWPYRRGVGWLSLRIEELRALKVEPHICWILCYNTAVHLKVKGPKKPSRGTIRKDADYLRATCAGAAAMKA